MRYLLALLLFAVAYPANAQAATQCVCTTGCVIVSDPAPLGNEQPTSCNLYKSGVLYASTNVVLASTIVLNANSCRPSMAAYPTPAPGSVACAVNVPPLSPGSYSMTLTFVSPYAETAQSLPLVFDSVASLPTPMVPPTKPRVK